MPVYLPTAAIGNGAILSTLGAAGELMTLFYPRIDFAQNIHECMPALFIGEPGHGRFLWCFVDEFTRSQSYVPDTNIVHTELIHRGEPLAIRLTDFAPPSVPSVVRSVVVENTGSEHFTGTFFHYFDFRLGEATGKQAVRYCPEEGWVLQYFRDISLIVGGTRPDVYRCGKSVEDGERSAKTDMLDGHLNGQPEDIGQVNFSLGWHLSLAPGERRQIEIICACGETREDAQAHARHLAAKGSTRLAQETTESAANWLSRARPANVDGDLAEAYHRALLSLQMLCDRHTGSVVAAPEFDPAYLRCGGYGYCWPRDATEAAIALRDAGYSEYLSRLADWYAAAQLPSGLWAQRYWADQHVGPSWSLREDFLQIDQSAAAVIALAERVLNSEDADPRALAGEYWPNIVSGALALESMVSESGLHKLACDLWETYCGVFVYGQAAIHEALLLAAQCAQIVAEDALRERWQSLAASMKRATLDLFDRGYFPRGLWQSGHVDHTVDSSTLGLVEPFMMLNLSDAAEREMYELNMAMIESRLSQHLDGGVGIRRYEGDNYLEGVIGCVNTLWMARSMLHLAEAHLPIDPAKASDLRRRAVDYIRFALAHTTQTGLLPELIGLAPDAPYWAAPHAWASGLLVKCALAL